MHHLDSYITVEPKYKFRWPYLRWSHFPLNRQNARKISRDILAQNLEDRNNVFFSKVRYFGLMSEDYKSIFFVILLYGEKMKPIDRILRSI